ncbi:hypothetical protein HNY73_007210 [Argiope bruennichi]|uniref:Uncharacterized protein n=1 Tax=Argiope bruennichi TaxID=94029 RepID=A0A8T0FFW6_ARGBR|nr:hypothetical protein HNY73_007210 [Argiope bruennichi]
MVKTNHSRIAKPPEILPKLLAGHTIGPLPERTFISPRQMDPIIAVTVASVTMVMDGNATLEADAPARHVMRLWRRPSCCKWIWNGTLARMGGRFRKGKE